MMELLSSGSSDHVPTPEPEKEKELSFPGLPMILIYGRNLGPDLMDRERQIREQ
jgi:hypothetical protein